MKIRPEIRFNEFTEEIPLVPMAELGNFIGGGTPDKEVQGYWEGDIPWISSSDIEADNVDSINVSRHITEQALKESATKLIPANSLLFVSRVGVGKLAVNKTALCTSQDFTNFTPTDMAPRYVAYFFQKNRNLLNRYSQGTSIKGLTSAEIKKIKITVPNPVEQQKIADFFTAVDKKISLLTEKHALLEKYKKGVVQKLFKQEIRFKDDSGSDFPSWQSLGFGEVFERITRKNKEDNQNVLTISAQVGLVNQEKYFNKSVSAKDLTGYYLLENGDFAYNKSYSKGYPMGAIKRLNNYDKGVVSTLYICFRVVGDQEPLFWEQFFEAGQLNREINKIAQEGARNHGLLNVSVTEFFNDIEVPVPSRAEQRKISDFLRVLDRKLDAVKQQIELTQTFKKGLLQQMFV
ncbi:MAG: restriction endonuclease subunit S [Pseudomonadota bacterium]|nr:restriction endonuclease subunit S [Pseudomonadota bacterium]